MIGDEEPPLSIEPVFGFRTWHMTEEGVLTGQLKRRRWYRHSVAICARSQSVKTPPCSVIPNAECQCGFYGYWTYETLQESMGFGGFLASVRGVVMGWGRTALADKGFRSLHACPAALLRWPERRGAPKAPFSVKDHGALAEKWEQIAGDIAENYRVPLVDHPDELMDAALASADTHREIF
jgi:hypothetical protein